MNKLFDNLNKTQKTLVVAIIATLVFALSTTASYSIFAGSAQKGSNLTSSLPTPTTLNGEKPSDPKTEACPLNGDMHSKEARAAWEKHRPLAVMIENHTEARPQSGLGEADVVYEAVAEGGITRFMALFYCNSLADVQVGPVRSARTYFIDWLSEYDGLYAHVGGANSAGPADALGQIIDYKIKDLNQFGIGFPTYWRDYQRLGRPVATEHTMYSTTQKLWAVGEKKGWGATDSDTGVAWATNFVPWKFKADNAGGTTTRITVNFWDGYKDFTVDWNYDKDCNCYKRNTGGTAHIDLDTNQQLSSKNIVVRFMVESHANDGYENNAHLLYGDKGSGKALVFQDGKVIEGSWKKLNRLSRETFYDKTGKEITFNKGVIWLQAVPEGSHVTY